MSGLGIKLEQIVFYIICFVITMLILDRFLFRSVVKILNDREDGIRRALDEKDEIEHKLAEVDQQVKNILSQAQEESRTIVKEARDNAEPEKQKVIESAHLEAQNIVSQSHRQADEIVTNARQQSESEAVSLVRGVLTKAMANIRIGAEEQQKVLENIITRKL